MIKFYSSYRNEVLNLKAFRKSENLLEILQDKIRKDLFWSILEQRV